MVSLHLDGKARTFLPPSGSACLLALALVVAGCKVRVGAVWPSALTAPPRKLDAQVEIVVTAQERCVREKSSIAYCVSRFEEDLHETLYRLLNFYFEPSSEDRPRWRAHLEILVLRRQEWVEKIAEYSYSHQNEWLIYQFTLSDPAGRVVLSQKDVAGGEYLRDAVKMMQSNIGSVLDDAARWR